MYNKTSINKTTHTNDGDLFIKMLLPTNNL